MGGDARSRLGMALLVGGLTVSAVGIVGLLVDSGDDGSAAAGTTPSIAATTALPPATATTTTDTTAPTRSSTTTATTATTQATPTTQTTSTTETTPTTQAASATTAAPETVQEFFARFGIALRDGDAEFLISRLHPAAIERYGEQQCRDLYAQVADPLLELDVVSVVPEAWRWQTADGADRTFPDAFTVTYRQADSTGTQEVVGHVVPGPSGTLLFLSDCGDPTA